ncbi:MAG: branched-chain amino acid transport system permease protein [Acidimicrobiaceae bacterium]
MSLLLSDYWVHFSTNVAITALAALGLYVCFIAGQYSLGHAALLGSGSYAAGTVSMNTGLSPIVGIACGVLAGAGMGLVMGGLLGLRLREFYLAIGTLAFNLGAVVVVLNTDALGGTLGLLGVRLEDVGDYAVGSVILVATGIYCLERTRLGRAMRALHDDEVLAAANGVRVWRVKLAAFTIGGAITGLGGGLYAHYLAVVRPENFGFQRSSELWVPVIVGGTTLVIGPIVGAIVSGLIPEVINRYLEVDPILIAGCLLMVVALFRPVGLIRKGDVRRLRTWWRRRREGRDDDDRPDDRIPSAPVTPDATAMTVP